jgi:hypothetical protein
MQRSEEVEGINQRTVAAIGGDLVDFKWLRCGEGFENGRRSAEKLSGKAFKRCGVCSCGSWMIVFCLARCKSRLEHLVPVTMA